MTHRSLTLRTSRRTSENLLESRDHVTCDAATRAFLASPSSRCSCCWSSSCCCCCCCCLLLIVLVSTAAAAAGVAVEVLAVGRELDFDDRRVVGVLERLGVVLRVHHVEIVIAREEDGLVVRRERRPAERARLRLVVLEEASPARWPCRTRSTGSCCAEAPARRRGRPASAAPTLPPGLLLHRLLLQGILAFVVRVEACTVIAALGRPLLDLLGRRLARLGRGDDRSWPAPGS